MQIFLRHDRSLTLDVDAADTIAGVKGALAAKTGLPADEMRLVCEGKLLQDVRTLAEHSVAHHATLHVVFGLRGGKGGFGAMLRTAGTRGVKTTNFDACRDLNGRRLRHVNAEAQLREWDAQAEERKLKKQQQTALNAKPTGPPPIARFDDDEYDEMLESKAEGKRKAVPPPAATSAPAKAAKLNVAFDPLAGLGGSGSEDDDDDDDEAAAGGQ